MEGCNKSLEGPPRFIKVEQHKTEDSSSSSSIEKHLTESGGAGPSSYELKSENIDLGELKMDEDEASSESFKEDNRRGEQDLTRQYMRAHGGRLKVTCCIKCEKKFSSKRCLDNHIIMLHRDDVKMMNGITSKVHCCEHCEYITTNKSNLTTHMRAHEENFGVSSVCMKCKKMFLKKQSLDNHIMTSHSGDVKMMNSITSTIHRCEHCKYVTVIKSSLTNHMRVHGEKFRVTFICIKCEKNFTRKLSLDNHILKSHSDDIKMIQSITCKIYCCEHCKYVTTVKSNLTEHMRMHGEKFSETSGCIK